VRASPDGYTLLMAGGYNAINATLYDKLNFNFIRDITAVAGIVRVPSVMVVHPSVPATTVPEFIAYAKSKPGKTTMASAGKGAPSHLAGELFKIMAGVDMVTCPIVVAARRSPISSPGRCRSCSPPLSNRSGISGLVDCACSR
jgi:tripartite-type tricarboxylate transporter receptor subunit TctC